MFWLLGIAAAVIAAAFASRGSTAGMPTVGTLPGQTPVSPLPPNPVGGLASQTQLQSQQGGLQSISGLAGIAGSGVALGGSVAGLETGAIAGTTAVAGIATAGVGIVAGIAVMLWQAHEQRMKDATNENDAWNVIYPDWMNAIQQIMQAFNSGQIDAPTAAAEFESLRALVYQDASRFKNMPGISWSGGNAGGTPVGLTSSQKIWQVQCDKSCTIGCCLFNSVVGPNTNRAIALVMQQPVMLAGGNTVMTNAFQVPAIPSNSTYGFNGAPAFILQTNTVG